MSIRVEHITKIYGEQKALDDVSFEIPDGQVVGFLGPNGAGKSTMMKIISCFIPQTDGTVEVAGHDVTNDSLEVRKKVGYLPENNPLYLDMYVKEYLEFIAGVHKVKDKDKRIAEMINMVGLQVEQKKKIGALSKGYRQRVGLAQAMIHDPDVLILDEPTTGLDPNQLEEIRQLIKSLGEKKTVMLSTHIMQEVEAICDRVIIINRGKIVADGAASEVRDVNVQVSVFVVEFDKPAKAADLKEIKGVNKIRNTAGNSWEIEADAGVELRNDLFKFAVDNGLTILTMNKKEQRLEEAFKSLTK